jgi:hypothetical protein
MRKTYLLALVVAILALSAAVMGISLTMRRLGRTEGTRETVYDIRDLAMEFIKRNHPETERFMAGIEWRGGRQPSDERVGAETYRFSSQAWNCTISYTVVLNPKYGIVVGFSTSMIPGYTGEFHEMVWKGTYQNGVITETSYTFK